jgi:hypothetical protein
MPTVTETLLKNISNKLDKLLELMRDLIRMLGQISKK